MDKEIIRRILNEYELEAHELLPAQKGYRNESRPIVLHSGQTVNLMLYKSEPGMLDRIRRANSVSDFLSLQGFPTRRTLSKNIIRLKSGTLTRYGAIYNYLPGQTIPWEAYSKLYIKLLGATMSNMHATLKAYKATLPSVADEYLQITERMGRYFRDPHVQQAMQRKLALNVNRATIGEFNTLLAACKKLPNQQALHMDFVRGNILFDTAGVSGILDFEKVSHGHPLFDIARTLAFLLVDCKYTPDAKVRKYFLYSGYNKRGTSAFRNILLTAGTTKINLLEQLLDLFLFYDFYKFLRHNPYEFLEQNNHFVRTRDLLVERQVIAYNNRKGATNGRRLEEKADFAE